MTSSRASSVAFGLLMVAAAALRAEAPGLLAASGALVFVVVSVLFQWAATLAVLCCVTALALSDASPVSCALAGFAAAGFLVLGRAVPPRSVTAPTVVAVLAATAVGLAATAVPVQLPWAPLAAAPAALVAFVVLADTLRRRVRTAAAETRAPPSLRDNEV